MEAALVKGGSKIGKALDAIKRKLGGKTTLRVGFLEGATYPIGGRKVKGKGRSRRRLKGASAGSGGKLVAMVAAIQEFGAPKRNIPPRPYFRTMIKRRSPNWGPNLGRLLKRNDYDAAKSMKEMGEGIKGQLQTSIRDLESPPLSPRTVAAKGFSKPLIDTGHMLNSVDYEVLT